MLGKIIYSVLIFVSTSCVAPKKHRPPPCAHENPHQCKYADPTQLEFWEDEVAFGGL